MVTTRLVYWLVRKEKDISTDVKLDTELCGTYSKDQSIFWIRRGHSCCKRDIPFRTGWSQWHCRQVRSCRRIAWYSPVKGRSRRWSRNQHGKSRPKPTAQRKQIHNYDYIIGLGTSNEENRMYMLYNRLLNRLNKTYNTWWEALPM